MFSCIELQEQKVFSTEFKRHQLISLGVCLCVLASALAWVIVNTEKSSATLAKWALKVLSDTGVENPVTAVLLNYRSYDTMLEVAVLMIIAVAIIPTVVRRADASQNFPAVDARLTPSVTTKSTVLAGLLKWLVSLSILISAYLLWTGAFAPGGAFQAGAMLAGAGLALSVTKTRQFHWQSFLAKLSIAAGLVVFIVVSFLSMVFTGVFMEYPKAYAGILILIIEIAATLTIASILLSLFVELDRLASVEPERDLQ